MTLNFPDAPSVGQQFPDPSVPNTPTWRWDGEKWASVGWAMVDAPSDDLWYGRLNKSWVQVTPEIIKQPDPGVFDVWIFSTVGLNVFRTPQDTKPSTLWRLHLQGGGGGGGGKPPANPWPGQGGGGGEYYQLMLSNLPAETDFQVFVGDGGGAGPALGTTTGHNREAGNAGPGQATWFRNAMLGLNLLARGGEGGAGANAVTYYGLGGIGGGISAGSIARVRIILSIGGADGLPPVTTDHSAPGAHSFFGFGATVRSPAMDLKGYGGGGRGAFTVNTAGEGGKFGLAIIERVSE